MLCSSAAGAIFDQPESRASICINRARPASHVVRVSHSQLPPPIPELALNRFRLIKGPSHHQLPTQQTLKLSKMPPKKTTAAAPKKAAAAPAHASYKGESDHAVHHNALAL